MRYKLEEAAKRYWGNTRAGVTLSHFARESGHPPALQGNRIELFRPRIELLPLIERISRDQTATILNRFAECCAAGNRLRLGTDR